MNSESRKFKKSIKKTSYVRKRKKKELPKIESKKIEVKSGEMEISVVVPIHNALAYSLLTLESLRTHAVNQIEIIPVCDRCESIVVRELKERNFDPIEVDLGDYHLSAMAGFEKVNSPWVIFCNSDMVFGPEWDAPLLRELKANPKIIASSLQFQRYETLGWVCALENPEVGVWTKPNLPFHPQNLDFKWWFNLCNEIKQKYNHQWVQGWHIAQMILSRKVFDEIGLFNRIVTDGRKERSMYEKMKSLGFSCQVVLDSQVFHFVGASINRYEDNDLSKIKEWWPF